MRKLFLILSLFLLSISSVFAGGGYSEKSYISGLGSSDCDKGYNCYGFLGENRDSRIYISVKVNSKIDHILESHIGGDAIKVEGAINGNSPVYFTRIDSIDGDVINWYLEEEIGSEDLSHLFENKGCFITPYSGMNYFEKKISSKNKIKIDKLLKKFFKKVDNKYSKYSSKKEVYKKLKAKVDVSRVIKRDENIMILLGYISEKLNKEIIKIEQCYQEDDILEDIFNIDI